MAAIHIPRVLALLFLCTCLYSCTIVSGAEYDDFDFDGLPGVQHEFKIEVQAGREECFHQKVAEGANLHMSFEVLRGADRLVDVFLKDPNFYVVSSNLAQSTGQFDLPARTSGVYTICLDNTFSRMASKLVYVYLITFVPEEWTKYVQEIEDMNMAVTNFTYSISVVQKSLEQATLHQASSRMNVVKDWYLIMSNNSYIVKWSIAQMCVVTCSSIFTVLFVRRLFKISNVTPSQKPRA
ncbi:transmembrane emp24 domain-containing protein 6-like isoform X3 [Mizuhopecten yessoensis]|uniref:Transmembrane emp24 domain-containing protein 6 n=1 Tax=Mizuhopecten yessoensis TaxID=6573 RepID=A0A210R553_MIZYE|nr:transmembrane emp24 domain-containing protein 6-like isoform X3 [Mizuhopecten yessoensis]OWF56051.1 Transmembrane emp24 domain-containing protein 6 [Mizuhopecten yessoensis]